MRILKFSFSGLLQETVYCGLKTHGTFSAVIEHINYPEQVTVQMPEVLWEVINKNCPQTRQPIQEKGCMWKFQECEAMQLSHYGFADTHKIATSSLCEQQHCVLISAHCPVFTHFEMYLWQETPPISILSPSQMINQFIIN